MTVSEVVQEALEQAGAVFMGDSPSPSDTASAMRTLNFMLTEWSGDTLMVRGALLESFTLTPSVRSYTIGLTGTFATPKPLRIVEAFLTDSNNVVTPVSVVPPNEFDDMAGKIITVGTPNTIMYDPGVSQQISQLGIIYVYPTPDPNNTYTLSIRSDKMLTKVASINDNIILEEVYGSLITYTLAVRLWGKFHQRGEPVPRDLKKMMTSAKNVITAMNYRASVSVSDMPGSIGVQPKYNIYSDGR